MNRYDELLKKCASEDELRPMMMKPIPIGEYIYSTNGHVLVRIPRQMVEGEYAVHADYPEFPKTMVSVLPKEKGERFIVRADDLSSVIKEVPSDLLFVTNEDIMQETDGYIQCDCCNAYGKVEKAYKYTHYLRLDKTTFNVNYCEIVLNEMVAEGLGCIEVEFHGETSAAEFFVGKDIYFLIMPTRHEGHKGYVKPDQPHIYHEVKIGKDFS